MEITSLNINKSEIARELNVDRRTVSKYIEGFQNLRQGNGKMPLQIFAK
jgi:predicted regulator of amino acid metabolism with ACT domain